MNRLVAVLTLDAEVLARWGAALQSRRAAALGLLLAITGAAWVAHSPGVALRDGHALGLRLRQRIAPAGWVERAGSDDERRRARWVARFAEIEARLLAGDKVPQGWAESARAAAALDGPPAVALLTAPASVLPLRVAAVAWWGAHVLALAWMLWVLGRLGPTWYPGWARQRAWVAGLSVLLLLPWLGRGALVGAIDLPLAALLLAVFRWDSRRRPWRAGAALGLALAVAPASWFVAGCLALRGRARSVITAVLVAAVLVLASRPLIGGAMHDIALGGWIDALEASRAPVDPVDPSLNAAMTRRPRVPVERVTALAFALLLIAGVSLGSRLPDRASLVYWTEASVALVLAALLAPVPSLATWAGLLLPVHLLLGFAGATGRRLPYVLLLLCVLLTPFAPTLACIVLLAALLSTRAALRRLPPSVEGLPG